MIIELSANRTIALLNDTIAITASATQFNLPFTADSIRATLPELLFNNGQLRVFIFPREDGAGLIELSPADTFSIHTEATFLVTSQVPGNFVFNVSPHRPNTITSPAGGLQLVFVDRVREIFITWSPTDYTDLADSSRIIPTLARSFTLYLWALQESGEYIRIPGEWIVAEDSSQIFQNFTFATADSAIFTLSRGRGGKVRIRAAVEIGGEEFGYITADIFIFDKIAVGIYPNPAIIRNNNILHIINIIGKQLHVVPFRHLLQPSIHWYESIHHTIEASFVLYQALNAPHPNLQEPYPLFLHRLP